MEARGCLQGLKDCKVLATLAGVQIKHFETQDDRQVTPEEIGRGQYANFGLFGDKDSVDCMLQLEIDHHMTEPICFFVVQRLQGAYKVQRV